MRTILPRKRHAYPVLLSIMLAAFAGAAMAEKPALVRGELITPGPGPASLCGAS